MTETAGKANLGAGEGRFLWQRRFRAAAVWGLYLLAVSLPLAEATTHAGFVLFFFGGMAAAFLEAGGRLRRPDRLEAILLLMAAVALVSAVLNWPLLRGLRGPRVALTLLSLFWLMYRGTFSEREVKNFLYLLIAASAVGLVWGLWRWQAGRLPALEMPSAGVVTQASIFLGVVVSAVYGLVLAGGEPRPRRVALTGCLFFFWVCLVLMGSRGGLLGAAAAAVLTAAAVFRNRRARLLLGGAVLAALVVLAAGYLGGGGSFWEKRVRHLFVVTVGEERPMSAAELSEAGDLMRLENWRIAWAQITQGGRFWLGVGPRNYGAVKVEALRFDPPLRAYGVAWKKLEHGHNLFLTKWAEEGFLGLLAFLALLAAVAGRLLAARPSGGEVPWWWPAALGALVVPVVGGSFNSPFYNEFAWLAMMLMGYACGRLRTGLAPCFSGR